MLVRSELGLYTLSERMNGVSTCPGDTTTQRMPSAAYDAAAERVSPTSPILPAAYPGLPPPGRIDASEPRLTITPPPARRIDGTTAFVPRNEPVRIVPINTFHISSV